MKSIYTAVILILFGPLGIVNARQPNPDTESMLSEKQRKITTISAYTAKGDLERLKVELNAALDARVTINEIKEVLVHLYAYCGFPRSIRGIQTFMEVLDERKAKGITDERGADASPVKDDRSKYERGTDVLVEITKLPPEAFKGGYAEFAPELEIFLKEHLFADLFGRDVLTYPERQLVTVSVLASIGGVEPMLRSHLNNCLNVGLTSSQLKQFVEVIKSAFGRQEAEAAQSVLDEVLKNRK